MPRPTTPCTLLLLVATSPGCLAPLTFVRTAPDVAWNQTLPGTDDPEEDGLSLVLHAISGSNPGVEKTWSQAGLLLTRLSLALSRRVSSTHVPVACNGTVIRRGFAVGVHYTGRVANDSLAGTPGAVFANTTAGAPLYVLVGAGEVVRGWELGLLGLCEGERAELTVPPELAFGTLGDGATISS